jgi:geranylgeranyl diphosphate synthase type I
MSQEKQYTALLDDIKVKAKKIDAYFEQALDGHIAPLWPAAKHYLKAGGKRLRPYIVQNVIELLQGNVGSSIPIAAAVEALHNFTLIHDDIMDRDETRRGVPTVHTKWDEPTAILAGDLLFAMVFVMVNQAPLDAAIKSLVSFELGNVCRELCEGQTMDMGFEDRENVTMPEYMEMIRLKTGALFRTSAVVGGICANATPSQLAALRQYGETMGIAFQIVDDILGLTADEKELGKPVCSDIREGKQTFLLIYAKDHLGQKDLDELNLIMSTAEKLDSDVQRAKELIVQSGAIEAAKQKSIDYMDLSIASLQILKKSESRGFLEQLARLTVERNY